MRILLKYPTRSRPDLFRSTLTRWREMLSGKHEARFVISCDEDDDTMNNAAMRGWIAEQPGCVEHFNPPPQTKITAINANIPEFDGLLILCSDDMLPEVTGYDDRIVTLFREHFPEGDGVLHTNDGRAGRTLNTLPILDSKYLARLEGRIYRSEYKSVYCDNEFQEVSERLGRAVYVDEEIFHHAWIEATGRDPLHRRNEASAVYQADKLTFEKRQRAGFPA